MFRNGFWVSFSRPSLDERHLTKIDGSKVFACLRKSNSIYLAFSLNFVWVSYSRPTITILILRRTFSCSLSVGLLFSLYNLLSLITFLSVAFHLFMSSSWSGGQAGRGSETIFARSASSVRSKDFSDKSPSNGGVCMQNVSPLHLQTHPLEIYERKNSRSDGRWNSVLFCWIQLKNYRFINSHERELPPMNEQDSVKGCLGGIVGGAFWSKSGASDCESWCKTITKCRNCWELLQLGWIALRNRWTDLKQQSFQSKR